MAGWQATIGRWTKGSHVEQCTERRHSRIGVGWYYYGCQEKGQGLSLAGGSSLKNWWVRGVTQWLRQWHDLDFQPTEVHTALSQGSSQWQIAPNTYIHIHFTFLSFLKGELHLEDFAAYQVGCRIGMFVIIHLFVLLLSQLDTRYWLLLHQIGGVVQLQLRMVAAR